MVGERIGLVVVVVAMVVVVFGVVVDKVQKVVGVVDKYFHRLNLEVKFDYVIDP